jgi:hypothetical protein
MQPLKVLNSSWKFVCVTTFHAEITFNPRQQKMKLAVKINSFVIQINAGLYFRFL